MSVILTIMVLGRNLPTYSLQNMLYNSTLKHIPVNSNQLITTRIIPFSEGG
jgi:hypothetical protein